MSNIDIERELSADLLTEAVSWRHHLHRHPELAYQERKTSDFVAEQLGRFGLKVHRGLAGTGVVGTLSRGTSRRTISIRADMDALPIKEQSGATYASSIAGVMHACGHDGHVAMALAAARVCARMPELDGTVHFIFQPAEEGHGGARRMIDDGLFKMFPCDSIYAMHNWPALPVGSCIARNGAIMSAIAMFEIVISGRGCHGAMPQEGTDSVIAGCHTVVALQSIVSRNVDPLEGVVVSATQIRAGDAWNIIPDTCVIRGTTRWFDSCIGEIIERRIIELTESIASGFGCKAKIHYKHMFPATVNDSVAAERLRSVASAPPVNLKVLEANPTMGSEDFSVMLQTVPGCYLLLGAGKPGTNHGLHSSCYDFNDELIPLGASLWISLVRKELGQETASRTITL